MRDALQVRRRHGIGERNGHLEEPSEGDAAPRHQIRQRLPLHQLHGDEVEPLSLFHRIHGDDVGMVQGGDGFRLSREPRSAIGVFGYFGRQDLEGDLPIELVVVCQVHLAHATGTKFRHDAVMADRLADPQGGHVSGPTLYTIRRWRVRSPEPGSVRPCNVRFSGGRVPSRSGSAWRP